MKKIIFILFSILVITHLKAQEKPAFSNMDVFGLEWADNPQIAPEGKTIVYQRRGMDIMKDRRTSQLWIMNSDGTNHQKLTPLTSDEYNAKWSPDGDKIIFTSASEHGSEVYIYWTNTQKVAKISQLENSPGNLTWSRDGKWIAFTMFVDGSELSLVSPPKKPKGAKWADTPKITTRLKHERDGSGKMKPGYTHIYLLSADGGVARQITEGNFNHGGKLAWSADNKSIVFSSNRKKDWEYDFRNSELYEVNILSKKITQLTDRNGPDYGPTISKDGKTIAYLGYDDKVQAYQINHIYLMDMQTKAISKIALKLDRNVSNLQWAAKGKGIYFNYDDKGNTKIGHTTSTGKFSTIADNVGGTGVARPYGGGKYSISKKGDVVYPMTTPYYPAEVGISKNNKSKKLTTLNDDLLPYRELGKVEEIWYKSTYDDRDIQGWIVYPPHFKSDSLYPLLVENHGGPIANYGDRFSPEMQLLAAAGYVVFYPNPRGSTSYGEEFGNLLYNNYPGQDYNDVMDGIDAVIAKGVIAKNELYVTGGSAGGIMTAWMIGKSDRFKSAAVIKPVMNWISKTLVADNYFYYANSRYPGQPWENLETYWKFSPISLVGNINTPTMVMVGSKDLRTPLSEAKQLYHALKIRKVETALVEVPGSYHFIAKRPSQLITKIDHILAWFERTREMEKK